MVNAPLDLAELSPEERELLEIMLMEEGWESSRLPISKRKGAYHSPLSFAQERFWVLQQLQMDAPVYNEFLCFRLRGPLNVEALKRSLHELLRRHEVLRSSCASIDGDLFQYVHGLDDIPFLETDLRHLPAENREVELKRLAKEEAVRPFVLNQGPLFRVQLIQLGFNDYALFLATHHFVLDGWSLSILVGEISTFYDHYTSDGRAPLPDLPIQYGDYAHWQRGQLGRSDWQTDLQYWKRRMENAPPVLELPCDYPRPPVQTYRGATFLFALPADLTEQVKSECRSQGVTVFMYLLAVFKSLLYRYTQQEDLVCSSAVSTRNRPELESMIGSFANNLLLRSRITESTSFSDLLKHVKEDVLNAFAHQELPFEKLVEELNPERNLSINPLFQVEFLLHDRSMQNGLRLPEIDVEMLFVDKGTARFDLDFILFNEDPIHGTVEYNTDIFKAGTIERMLGHYTVLLRSALRNPHDFIARLDILTDEEYEQITLGNCTGSVSEPDQSIPALLKNSVRTTPQAIALIQAATSELEESQTQWTYEDLDAQSTRLARYLLSKGLTKESFVGIYMERSPGAVVALLAVLKAGGAYIPLDPAFPSERIQYMLKDSQAEFVLTQESLLNELPVGSATVICCDREEKAILEADEGIALPAIDSTQLAYVIYTSGSTGKPKGVLITHRSAVNFLHTMAEQPGCTEKDVLLSVTSFSFDISVLELFLPLFCGASVVLVSSQDAAQGNRLIDWIDRYNVTLMQATPATWRLLLESGWRGTPRLKALCGGEALTVELAKALYVRCRSLWNLYGPTETTVWSARHEVRQPNDAACIGRPIANTLFFVLDANRQPVPVGVPGELHIGGEGLARGYLHRPDLTDEKFIHWEYREQNHRLYRTGDLVKRREDGTLEFIGRNDYQVKVRGYRIELGEIETCLEAHPLVQKTIVTAYDDSVAGKKLVAYIVTDSGTKSLTSELIDYLKERLPGYMVPTLFIPLEQVPLTPNGKINRKALPSPDLVRPEVGNAYQAPRNPAEIELAKIWAQILKLKKVGIHDNFFELGGHSLLATQVISQIRKSLFPVNVPLRRLFESPTVAELAEFVTQQYEQQKQQNQTLSDLQPIHSQKPYGRLPLSFSQQRLWFLDQLEPDSSAYNISAAWNLTGSLDVAALQTAMQKIVCRHETLRSIVESDADGPYQVILPTLEFSIPIHDLSGVPDPQREADAKEWVAQRTAEPFVISEGPLFRMDLIRVNPNEHILVFVIHHIISDGWSIEVFFHELTRLYDSALACTADPLIPLPIQYADYAVWQREWLQGEALQRQLDYWKTELGGTIPVLQLPTDYPRPNTMSYHGGKVERVLNPSLSRHLKILSRREGATLFMTLLSAYAILLRRYSDQTDILIGTPIAGRNRSEVESLIGFFINTLVIRTNMTGEPTFLGVLGQVRDKSLRAYARQDLPFEKLVEELQPERELSRTPLFQVFFNMLNFDSRTPQFADLTAKPYELPEPEPKFDLTLYAFEKDEQVHVNLHYNADVFSAERMAELMRQYEWLLEQAVEDPNRSIQAYSLVTLDMRKRLPDPAHPIPVRFSKPVHQQFSEQAARVPNRLAVQDSCRSFTYQELEQISNRLANDLIAHGVTRHETTAIYASRDATLVLSILGVLKAGASFVILNPTYPIQNLIKKLELSRPTAWIQCVEAEEIPLEIQNYLQSKPLKRRWTLSSPDNPSLNTLLESASNLPPEVKVGPDDLAYIAFTSGTTGEPKGIIGTHGCLAHFMEWHSKEFNFREMDRFSMLSGLSHDPLLRDIFTPLWNGASIHIPHSERMDFPDQLAVWMRQEGITVAHLTPALGSIISKSLKGLPKRFINAAMLEDLQYAFYAGDVLTRSHITQLKRIAPAAVCVNFFGATETPQAMSYYVLPEMADSRKNGKAKKYRSAIPIGKGIDDVQILVVNRARQLAGVGELGEICIRTPWLSKGYLNNEELTSEKFFTNPFTGETEDRVYRTGDLGRYLPDSCVEFYGRSDRQVKIRGFRVELEEIEAVLMRHERIDQCVTVVFGRKEEEKKLAVYFTCRTTVAPSHDELVHYARQHFPDYMVPAAFVRLDSIPLTANGKVDYAALPAPDCERPELQRQYVAPRNEMEERIVPIWEEVLGIKQIGIYDNFFELGGHSMSATRLASRLRETFHVELPLRCIFVDPTIAGVAKIIGYDETHHSFNVDDHDSKWQTLVPMQPLGSRRPLFLVAGAHADEDQFLRYLSNMIPHLGMDQPVYGFKAKGLDGKSSYHATVQEMARDYLQELRSFQPQGPYLIGGECVGGIVAYEMAQQLCRDGQKVNLLVLLDTPCPTRWRALRSHWIYKWIQCRNRLRQLIHAYKLDGYHSVIKLAQKKKQEKKPLTPLDRQRLHIRQVEENYPRVLFRYQPEPYFGKLTLIVNEKQFAINPSYGWKKWANGGIEILTVPGNHLTRLMKYGKISAECLRKCLDTLQKGKHS